MKVVVTAARHTPCCSTRHDPTCSDRAGWFKLAAEGACSEEDAGEERDAVVGPSEYTDRVAEAVYRTVLQAAPRNNPCCSPEPLHSSLIVLLIIPMHQVEVTTVVHASHCCKQKQQKHTRGRPAWLRSDLCGPAHFDVTTRCVEE